MGYKPMSVKNLRTMVSSNSTTITNRELAEASRLVDFKSYWNLDHSTDFVLTKDKEERDELYDTMCCGTCSLDIVLSNNQTLYFACSYGH